MQYSNEIQNAHGTNNKKSPHKLSIGGATHFVQCRSQILSFQVSLMKTQQIIIILCRMVVIAVKGY